MSRTKLVLIDGNSITYRAFFALPALSNARGQVTNAVFGFTQMLLKILQDEQPTHIAVAFDAGKKTFRHDHFEAYKGTRQETPNELREQFPLVRELLDAFGIRWIEVQNFEADDIIGTLSRFSDAADMETLIVSGDKDLLQLVSEHVHAVLTKKGITEVDHYDPAAVEARFSLTPAQIVDLKGLMGDSSDNIPGVPGVGEKTAIKLLNMYPSVEEILEHIDEMPGAKLQERLRENRDLALLSKQLATIHRDVPIECTVTDLEYAGYDPKTVQQMFQKLEFKSLVDKITREIDSSSTDGAAKDGEVASSLSNIPVTVVDTANDLEALWNDLPSPIGLIADMDSKDYQTANILGLAVGSEDRAIYIDLTGDLELIDVAPLWAPEYEKTVFDLKTLIVLLDAHGQAVHADGDWFDVLLAAYLLNPSEGEVRLSDIVERELHITIGTVDAKTEARVETLARQATLLPQLRKPLRDALSAQELDDLYRDVELPLAFVLARMEAIGFYVDAERLRNIGEELTQQLTGLTKDIYALAGVDFNINSPKQLGEILFDKLGLPTSKKTKTGYSTSADVLERLAPYHEVVAKILEFRQVGKLQSTYVEGLLKVIRPETGRVHTRFHQALTATGRLSSSEPNLQNIPVRMEEGRKLRLAFEPSYEDWVIVSADYSQIELRILAHLSGDEALIDAFRQGMDIHTRTAADVFEVSPEEVTSLMRRQAKAVNFGIVYGISDYGLSQNLNIPRAQAAKFIADYFDKFPGVQRYMTDIVEGARKQGYVTTLLNRRRYLPDIHSKNFNLRSFAERTAMNTPIQGTAADIIKLAMVRIDKALATSDLKARMLLQVHDELIFECPEQEADTLIEVARDNMENALTLNVPLSVDIHHGKSWYEAK
ncbi:DNA polymerase I [Alicyclobacillus sp. ALC3]|uniref:DNA polymerase I n=1 Tax=Alicyclobacillus sp. ALC3 TaxID=2796143 RepID=UPI002377F6C2|nr:DNA polymerase I [Alicyclobacillus sp. ALC3]WDL95616.1 DNA polymerase I [Alicyclobacillus sp. ALC3]